jgi:electron transfer flavoprotein beta subunit
MSSTEQSECIQDDSKENMKILVCLKEIIDTALNIDFGLSSSVVFKEGLPRRLNPPDIVALTLALGLKKAGAEITAVSIGEESIESYLRNALAIGAGKSVRIRGEDFGELSPYQKALLLAGLAMVSGTVLVLTGSRSFDTGNGQVGLLLAAILGWPCVTDVVSIESFDPKSLTLVKDVGWGEREKVKYDLPAVVTVKGEGKLPYASLDNLIESKSREITVLKPLDLGITPETLKNAARPDRLAFPRPALAKAPPLDSSLPAFYRILQLLQGGIAKRKGQMLEGDAGQIAEQLYRLFLEEGVLKKRI